MANSPKSQLLIKSVLDGLLDHEFEAFVDTIASTLDLYDAVRSEVSSTGKQIRSQADQKSRISSLAKRVCEGNPDILVSAFLYAMKKCGIAHPPEIVERLLALESKAISTSTLTPMNKSNKELAELFLTNHEDVVIEEGYMIEKALYPAAGGDMRVDYCDLNDSLKMLANAVLSIWRKDDIIFHPDNTVTLKTRTFGDDLVLNGSSYCAHPSLHFLGQPRGAFGTAFCVEGNKHAAVTAAHCFRDRTIHNTVFVLGFKAKIPQNNAKECRQQRLPLSHVFHATRDPVFGAKPTNITQLNLFDDWAVFEIDGDPTVLGGTKLKLSLTVDPTTKDVISVIGHPKGLPLKYGTGRLDRWDTVNKTMLSALPTFKGNSGSPVLNSNNEVIGLLRGGAEDLEEASFRAVSHFFGKQIGLRDKCHTDPQEHIVATAMFAQAVQNV